MASPALPSLPSLPTVPTLGLTGGASGVGQAVVNAVTKGQLPSATSLLFGVSASRLIAVAVGLILIAAGVFSFKPVRETIITTGKAVGETAAAA